MTNLTPSQLKSLIADHSVQENLKALLKQNQIIAELASKILKEITHLDQEKTIDQDQFLKDLEQLRLNKHYLRGIRLVNFHQALKGEIPRHTTTEKFEVETDTPKEVIEVKEQENQAKIVDLIQKQELSRAKKLAKEAIKRSLKSKSIKYSELVAFKTDKDWEAYLEELKTSQAVAQFVSQVQKLINEKQSTESTIQKTNSEKQTRTNHGWIIGGVVLGSLVLIGLIVYLVLRKARK